VIVTATNPTSTAKAILIKGGHAIVGPGKIVEIDVQFGKEKAAFYEAAGIVFTASSSTTPVDELVVHGTAAPVVAPVAPPPPTAPVVAAPTVADAPATPTTPAKVSEPTKPPKSKKD
jgi:hypothetical protein